MKERLNVIDVDKVKTFSLEDLVINKQVSVNNLAELFPLLQAITQAINEKTQNITVEPPQVTVSPATVEVSNDFSQILNVLETCLAKLKANDKDNPLSVRLSDGKEWVEQLKVLSDSAQQIASFSSVGEVYIRDANGGRLNPATEESLRALSRNYATKLDDYTTTSVTYVGKALISSAGSSAVWQIFKMDETTGLVITWADGNDSFDNVWEDRASLTYS